MRSSIFRAGYELFYTPLAATTKRSAKSIIDVVADSVGKSAGAAVILIVTGLAPLYALAAVNVASVFVAGMEFLVTRRLTSGYVKALEGGLKRQSGELDRAAQYSLSDFTVVQSMAGLDRASVLRALGQTTGPATHERLDDSVVTTIIELRSGDPTRIRVALRAPLRDVLLVGALIPLLEQQEVLRPVIAALTAFGTHAAGQLVDRLLDRPHRHRAPAFAAGAEILWLQHLCDGLMQGCRQFQVRLRCGRASGADRASSSAGRERAVHVERRRARALACRR